MYYAIPKNGEYVKRLGRWVDMENEYRTMDKEYIESVWSVFKSLWDKGYIYQGKRILPYSPSLASTLSQSEAGLEYKEVQDPSITVRAKLTQGKYNGKSLASLATTLTLPANTAIAVDPQGLVKLKLTKQGRVYLLKAEYHPILNENRLSNHSLLGKNSGLDYQPFNCFQKEHNNHSFKVYGTDYVLHETGTGAVHTALCFGDDDFEAATQHNLPFIDHLDAVGHFLDGNPPDIVGLKFKAGDKKICQLLKDKA